MNANNKSSSELYQESTLVVATDSEWQGKKWVSTQFSSILGRYLYLTTYASPETRERVMKYCKSNGITCISVQMKDNKQLLEDYLKKVDSERQYQKLFLLMFYSPKDLEYTIGWDNMRELITSKKLIQKRNIKNKEQMRIDERNVFIKDLKGWTQGSFQDLANSCAVTLSAKGEMDDYKTKMFEGLEAMPEKFVDYAMGDVDDLLKVYYSFIDLVKSVQGIVGIKEKDKFSLENIPMTVGSLVAKTIKKYIFTLTENEDLLRYCMNKPGKLDRSDKRYKYSLKSLIECKKYKTLNEVKSAFNGKDTDKYLKHITKHAEYIQTALSQASVKRFAKETNTGGFLAIVQGGRCNNERPSEYYVEHGADIDLASCYGSILSQYALPLGLPSVWYLQSEQQPDTLGKWLKKNQEDLLPNLWYVVIDTKLSFAQDLIYSKLVELEEINRSAFSPLDKETEDADRDDDLAHIPGVFCLLRKEIENGIITDLVLKILKAVCTNKELGEIMNAEVKTAAAYRASNQVKDINEWMKIVAEDKGGYYYKNDRGDSKDTRTRAWYGVSLNGFTGKLVDERKNVKNKMKLTDSDNEKSKFNALQETIKLFINSGYGVIASPYFEVSNTVVANNITAAARCGAWMVNKSLHTRQSITDGGFYCLLLVPYLKRGSFKPGLEILSDNTKWEDKEDKRYTRILKPLADLDWERILEKKGSEIQQLDKLARDHIDEFWSNYGLELPFNIEHKLENTFLKASYWNKGHYILITVDGKEITKIRGARDFDDTEIRTTPIYRLLKNILAGKDEFPELLVYDHRIILKIGKWNKSIEIYDLNNQRPGEEDVQERIMRFNNVHVFADTKEEYLSRFNRKRFIGKELQLFFEKFKKLGISEVNLRMLKDILE
jgi:hypothetical protein